MLRSVMKHYFWVYLWECLRKRLAFDSVYWIRKSELPQGRWASSNLLRGWVEQKNGGRVNLLCLNWDIHLILHLDIGAPDSWDFRFRQGFTTLAPNPRLSDLDWITPPAFLALQLADGRLWDFLITITVGAKSHYRFFFMYVSIYPTESVSPENSDW